MSKYGYIHCRSGREVDEDEATDRGILRDGYGLRVPVTLMDANSMERQMADHFRPAWDSVRREAVTALDGSTAGLHRPGFRVSDAYHAEARRRMYDEYDEYISNAWRGPNR
jgi:hypothetical protein